MLTQAVLPILGRIILNLTSNLPILTPRRRGRIEQPPRIIPLLQLVQLAVVVPIERLLPVRLIDVRLIHVRPGPGARLPPRPQQLDQVLVGRGDVLGLEVIGYHQRRGLDRGADSARLSG